MSRPVVAAPHGAPVGPAGRGRNIDTLDPQSPPPDPGPRELLEVHLLGLPLRILQRVREHHGELLREISLLALKPESLKTLPPRLRELIAIYTKHYTGQIYGGAAARSVPLRSEVLPTRDRADLVVYLERADALQANTFWSQLDEADQYCQRGGILLTIGNGPTERALMAWYFAEFVNQANGLTPQEWAGATR